MRKAAEYIFFSSFFISLCALGLVWETYLLTNIPADWRLAFLIFFATLFLYNFDGLLPYKSAQKQFLSEKKQWLLNHRKFLLALTGLVALGALVLYIQVFNSIPVLFLAPFFLISILYSLPVLPRNKRKVPLREIPFLKVFLIAAVWAGLTVLLPIVASGKSLNEAGIGLLALRRFLFIFALTLLFDIRDRAKDDQLGTVTFPVKFGICFTKKLAWFALLLFVGLVHFQETGNIRIALEGSALIAGLVVYFAEEKQPEFYFVVFADGMMLLEFLVVWFFVG